MVYSKITLILYNFLNIFFLAQYFYLKLLSKHFFVQFCTSYLKKINVCVTMQRIVSKMSTYCMHLHGSDGRYNKNERNMDRCIA